MSKAMMAGAVMVMMLGGCDRANPPEQPSPGAVPRPTVALPAAIPVVDIEGERPAQQGRSSAPPSGLFSAPGALPAAERHFELFQRINGDREPLIKASLGPEARRN